MSNDNTYNGWTNYATWRVTLECFDGWDISSTFSADEWQDVMQHEYNEMISLPHSWTNFEKADMFKASMVSYMVEYMRSLPEMFIEEVQDSMLNGWLHAWLDEVNWREVAEHFLQDDELYNQAFQNIRKTGAI